MNEHILHFPSGAKIIFDKASFGEPFDGYTIYIWPEDLCVEDELAEITEEDWNYLLERVDQRFNK